MAILTTLEKEERNTDNSMPDLEEYEEFILNDMDPDLIFTGKMYLGSIYSYDVDEINWATGEKTGNKITNYRARIAVVNEENQEYLSGQFKLKNDEDKIQVWKGSLAFDIIDSLDKLTNENYGEGKHNILKISFNELQQAISQLEPLTVQVIGHSMKKKKEMTFWNTMRITEIGG